jgi:hypothetical protein
MTTAAVATSPTTLTSILENSTSTLANLAEHLDALDAESRVREIREMPGRLQARVWQLAGEAAPYTLEDLVPAQLGEGKPVILAGKNSLPMFTHFEKRFARVGGKVVGYNHQPMSWITGPGYFTVVTATQPERQKELLIDYTQVPEAPVSVIEGWPRIKSNSSGFSYFVYNKLHDYLRRVSRDVVIGEATRMDKPMNSFFLIAKR